MRTVLVTYCFAIFCTISLRAAEVPEVIKQDFGRDDAQWIKADPANITEIVQSGKIRRYDEAMLKDGVHFKPGKEVVLKARIKGGTYHSGGLIGVHGKGSHVRFSGHWQGDQPGGYPMLVLRDGGRMTWEADAHIDFVMHPNYYTRQLWLWGDGTGTLEIAEGFISDRTKGATVADAMGTIRLVGTTLITHHSQSLPYNTRPDGRGGIYHNGHIVFEGDVPSKWIVKTNPHIYSAQLDFAISSTVDCQAPLTHNGQKRVCLHVGNGGPFISTGAFRTTKENVTITKTGPAMLSLEGQQGYRKGAKLIVSEGLLRFHTDPGDGQRYDKEAGQFLHLVVKRGAKVVISASKVRLAALTVEEGATVWQLGGCKIDVSGKSKIADAAKMLTGDFTK